MSPPLQSPSTLTVAVLTLNEARRIRECLASAEFADQLLVVDSGSIDGTTDIAREMGAEVHVYEDWEGFAVQRNRLLTHATGDYVFFLDADEVMSPAFAQELKAIVASGEKAVWKIRWRIVAFGQELRYFRASTKVERLFLRSQIKEYTGVVHEQAVLHSEPVPRHTLRHPLLHHTRPTVRAGLEKMTQYAMLGAAKKATKNQSGGILRGIFAGLVMFVRFYIFRLGFLCGGAGFLYCLFVALEAFFRYAALRYDRDLLNDSVLR